MSEKEVLSDFSELFQENYDRIPKELAQLTVSFKDLNNWLIKEIPKDMVDEKRPKLVYHLGMLSAAKVFPGLPDSPSIALKNLASLGSVCGESGG